MRLKLSMLFIFISMIALVFGILFMTPVFIAGVFCAFTMILTPAIWLTGAMYAHGIWRPFFIGGMFTGFFPHIVALYYAMLVGIQTGVEVFEKGLNLGVNSEELLVTRLWVAGIWAMPGIFAFMGGAASMLTYRILRGPEKPADQPGSFLSKPAELQ